MLSKQISPPGPNSFENEYYSDPFISPLLSKIIQRLLTTQILFNVFAAVKGLDDLESNCCYKFVVLV
jgi:hypothetical protein